MRSPGGWRRLACVSLLCGVAITALLAGPLPLVAVLAGLGPDRFMYESLPDGDPSGAWYVSYKPGRLRETWGLHYPGSYVIRHYDSTPLTTLPPRPLWINTTRRAGTHISTVASGWPARAMLYVHWQQTDKRTLRDIEGFEFGWRLGEVTTSQRREALVIPLRPIWPGLAADVAFWSLAVFSGRLGVRWLRARRRRRRGLCEVCAYPRTGLPADRACPECGTQP